MLEEIIQIAGCEDVVGKQLFSLRRDIPNERKDLDALRFAVGHWCGDGKVVEYLDNTTWEYFSFVKICSAFKNNQKELIINDMQRESIKPYCEKEFDNLNFANCKGDEYFNFAPFLVFAVINFNFCCDDERLLKMLYLPPHLFYNSSSSWETALIEFVIDKFSDKEKLRRAILDPRKLQTLNLSYKKNFVAYCRINKLQNAVDVAVELLSDGYKSSTDKQFLVDYLLDIKGQKYIDDKIVPNVDVELLGTIANKVKDDMPNLMQRLEDENERKDSSK